MSAVCVLTPMVVASWPAISTAVGGVAAALGFTIASGLNVDQKAERSRSNTVETPLPNSEVLEEAIQQGQSITIKRDGVSIVFQRDARGRCSLCVSGEKKSKAELRAIGDEVAGRFVQQFAYHKLVTELKQRGCEVIEEQTSADAAIHMRVRVHQTMS